MISSGTIYLLRNFVPHDFMRPK